MLRKMLKSRKGVTMSMNVIIAAVIALIILVVISILIMTRMGMFGKGTGCKGISGGECIPADADCKEYTGENKIQTPLACSEGEKCCIPSPV